MVVEGTCLYRLSVRQFAVGTDDDAHILVGDHRQVVDGHLHDVIPYVRQVNAGGTRHSRRHEAKHLIVSPRLYLDIGGVPGDVATRILAPIEHGATLGLMAVIDEQLHILVLHGVVLLHGIPAVTGHGCHIEGLTALVLHRIGRHRLRAIDI